MATPLDMQPVVDTQLESQKSNILEKTGEACKKLGIAVATAAALHCSAFAQSAVSSSPAAMLQVTKGSGVLTIDGKNMSFTEFLTKYPEQKERSAILGKMDEKTEDAFRDWEISMRKNESSSIEVALNQKKEERKGVNIALNQEDKELVNDKGGLNQKKEERKGVNIALIQITQVNAILDDLMQNQGLKMASESQKKINQEKGSIILAALDNPTITQGMKPETISILRTIGNSLQKGGNVAYINSEVVKNIKIAL